MIGILNYGVGNVRAFQNVYDRLGISNKLISVESDFDAVDRIILPGVGAFDHAMSCLNQSGLINRLRHIVEIEKKPVLGVCVGFQMMASSSEEGTLPGLGWFPGVVRKVNRTGGGLPIPHMGWNALLPCKQSVPILANIEPGQKMYFLHSYQYEGDSHDYIIAEAEYGALIPAIAQKGNVIGVQPHPEKSHDVGVIILKNFAEIEK